LKALTRSIIWVRIWARRYREECANSPSANEELDTLAEIRRLKKRMGRSEKGKSILKKAAAFFPKEPD